MSSWKAIVFGMVVMMLSGLALAQPRKGGASAPAASEGDALPLGSYLDERLANLDQELASAVLERAQAPAGQMAQVDLEIDLRILQRWVWDQMKQAKSADLQCALYARGLALEEAAGEVSGYLVSRQGREPTPSQAEALVKLHQLTYALEDVKDGAMLDSIAARAGAALINVAAVNAIDPARIRPMRPDAPAQPKPALRPQVDRDKNEPPTLDELAQQVQVMTVSAALRSQMAMVAKMAQEASLDPHMQPESARLTALLSEAVELAEGLAANTAVAPEQRMEIERQLTAGLALSADRRLKSAGETRMAALRPYRQTLVRVGKLKLTEEERARLANAISHAQANPDDADKIFGAVEQRREILGRYQALPPEPPADPAARKAIDEHRRQFEQSDGQFFESAANLGGTGVFASSAEELVAELGRMKRNVELLELLYKLPQRVAALSAYRPRPLGSLERRVATAAGASAVAVGGGQRDMAEAYVGSVSQIGGLALELANRPLGSISSPEAKAYIGDNAKAFDEQWRAIVLELATAAANGEEMEKGKIDRLKAHRHVIDLVVEAAEAGGLRMNWEALSRWADWTMRPEDFGDLLNPLQQELASAVRVLAGGESYNLGDYQRRKDRYAPILAFVSRADGYADQLQQLPTGLSGSCGKLLTPMATPMFEAERFNGLATRLWVYQDAETSQEILSMLAKRLAPEVGMRYREDKKR